MLFNEIYTTTPLLILADYCYVRIVSVAKMGDVGRRGRLEQ